MDKFVLDFILNNDNHYLVNNNKIPLMNNGKKISLNEFSFYHIEKLTFEDKAPRKEALENVISSLSIEGINFLYLITGNKKGVSFYFGVSKDLMFEKQLSLNVVDIGEDILKPNIEGNFRGSIVTEVTPDEKEDLLKDINEFQRFGFIEGVPGINEDSEDFQGVDRLIDVMKGDDFCLIVISKSLSNDEINTIEDNLYESYTRIAPFSKKNIQDNNSQSETKGTTITKGTSEQTGENYSASETKGKSINSGESEGTSKDTNHSKSNSTNNSSSSSGTSEGGSESSNKSKNWGNGENESTQISKGTSKGTSTQDSKADSDSIATTKGNSISIEYIEKNAQEWLKYLDEVIIPRLDYGKGKGLFITSAFLLSSNNSNIIKLGNTMKSLYSGKKGNKIPLSLHLLDEKKSKDKAIINQLKNFQIPSGLISNLSKNEKISRTVLSQFFKDDVFYMGNWITTNELSLIAGLPQKEVVGLLLKEEVEFGLNFNLKVKKENRIHLGKLIQSGRELKESKVFIDKDNLDKHIFITGVTGSGKTTTCQKILIDSNIPFLVIEPAKTEYRSLLKKFNDILIFTLGKNDVAPFKLNPFEFFPHESITSRVDMIKASIEASFDMEAAIPQIIETAIYKCYEDYGWNISTNENEQFENPFADGINAFPTLENLVNKIEKVVDFQGFDARLKNDYIGSIKARLQGLLVGSKGLMLNTKRSIDFKELVTKKVILEIEEIKSGSEKSLIMGFVLINLIEAVKSKHKEDKNFKHITLIEEAHRLLSKITYGDSSNKKQGVEVFSDMLAEVRKYGESLIIVDQIPNKLIPEVLKNTNTKIVHKLFAQDDKDAIGNTMALSDEQKNFLSNLETGRAILFTQGFSNPVQIQIEKKYNISENDFIEETLIRNNALNFYCDNYKSGVIEGFELFKTKPTLQEAENYIIFTEKIIFYFKQIFKVTNKNYDFKKAENYIKSLNYDIDFLSNYIFDKIYKNNNKEILNSINDFLEAVKKGDSIEYLRKKYDDYLKIQEV